MAKILTVVIPTYNMEKYLDRCLTSLIVTNNDLLERLEVLVVIDGAKDRSSEIAHSYQIRYPQTFIVIDKENGNYGSCVNRGVAEATAVNNASLIITALLYPSSPCKSVIISLASLL